jgi:type II secretory pathway pseudopilin PulG
LIELLVVLVIIGLLASIALPRFWGAREKAYQAQMQNDLRNLASAEEAYFESHSIYTTNLTMLEFNRSSGVTISVAEATGAGWSASASHTAIPVLCGMYYGTASAPAGIPVPGEGIVACN